MSEAQSTTSLKRGWTTGACAAGAARAAFEALLTGAFPDPVPVALPKGLRPEFALATQELGADFARAGIVKDAGDDPDVTHGALIVATVRLAPQTTGVIFKAGEGVGVVTRPGLPLEPGEPAINPAPRAMIRANLAEVASGSAPELTPWSKSPSPEARGSPSAPGTRGSASSAACRSWARPASSFPIPVPPGSTRSTAGSMSRAPAVAPTSAPRPGTPPRRAIRALYGLPDHALIDMGDFVGGLLKYLRRHPVSRLTLAGGPAKMTKLAQGLLGFAFEARRRRLCGARRARRTRGRFGVACRGDRKRQQRAARLRTRSIRGLSPARADRRGRMGDGGAPSRGRADGARDRGRRARRADSR